LAPQSFLKYIEVYWLPLCVMWLATMRVDQSIFEQSDTNMLVKVWHYLLNRKFLEGKRNQWLDHLIYLLLFKVVPYFHTKHYYQLWASKDLTWRRNTGTPSTHLHN
ncbi:hypothetical protein FIBSPDRAFT_764666, partial [Athelia psychrophila]